MIVATTGGWGTWIAATAFPAVNCYGALPALDIPATCEEVGILGDPGWALLLIGTAVTTAFTAGLWGLAGVLEALDGDAPVVRDEPRRTQRRDRAARPDPMPVALDVPLETPEDEEEPPRPSAVRLVPNVRFKAAADQPADDPCDDDAHPALGKPLSPGLDMPAATDKPRRRNPGLSARR